MEFIGKKRTNTNYLKSKSNEELINDQQNNTNKKVLFFPILFELEPLKL